LDPWLGVWHHFLNVLGHASCDWSLGQELSITTNNYKWNMQNHYQDKTTPPMQKLTYNDKPPLLKP